MSEQCSVEGCTNRRVKYRPWCSKHRARVERHGSVDGMSPARVGLPEQSLMRRLLTGVISDDDCWIWGRSRSDTGYGNLHHRGRQRGVHVWMWEAIHERPVPKGMAVCHTCDVRACINPAHLWLGTTADNAADMRQKLRQARGERHSQAKLTTDDVRAIRAHTDGDLAGLAAKYGVSLGTVWGIRGRRSWAWLDVEESA